MVVHYNKAGIHRYSNSIPVHNRYLKWGQQWERSYLIDLDYHLERT